MIPYIILLLTPIIIQHTHMNRVSYKKKNEIALFLFFIILTFLVMFRHESIGNDTGNYMRYFIVHERALWRELSESGLEIGYSVLNKLLTYISESPHFFVAATAIIISCLIYPTYKRLCVDASLTISLFCTMSTFVMMFSGIRQMLAIGVGFIAYECTRQKKLVPFIICVILAISFHTSAFMLFFMYPLYHAKITKQCLLVVVPALLVIFVFNRQIFNIMGLFLERYTKYEASVTQTGAYTMLFLFIIFAVFAFLIPEASRLNSETIGLRNFLLMTLVIQMFAPLHNLAMRMNYYYMIYIPLLLPKIIECRSTRWSQVAIFGRNVMVVFFCAYFFIVNASGGGKLNVFPYHFFWENV